MDLFTLPSFTLRQLSYLVAAADEGTIVGAAEKLHVAPSTLSDAISGLEKQLGTQLTIRRRAHGLMLTTAGSRAVADARLLLRQANELSVSLKSGADELAGPLAVGSFFPIAPIVFPYMLDDFQSRHPKVRIDTLEAPQDELFALLDSGGLDLALAYDNYLPTRMQSVKLYELPPYILLPVDHRLANSRAVRFEDIIDEDFVMLSQPPATEHSLSYFAARNLTPNIRYRASTTDIVRALVARGVGFGMLIQRDLSTDQLAQMGLVAKEIAPRVPTIATHAVWSPRITPSNRVRALVEFLQTIEWPRP